MGGNSSSAAVALPRAGSPLRQFIFAGLLPIVAFTVIEEVWGTLAGLAVGMAFGIFEILYERIRLGRVDPLTWGSNGLLIALGSISLATREGVFFKLQPALLEAAFCSFLWGTLWVGRLDRGSFLKSLLQKQGKWAMVPDEKKLVLSEAFRGLTLRMGAFMALHAALTVWAALRASSEIWAILKGVGFTVSLAVYLVVEVALLRYRSRKS